VNVDPQVVLITGCSSGIGREAARRFARAGFRVYASMRRPDDGRELREEAQAQGWALFTPALDVTSDQSVTSAVAALLGETGGRLDVLVNNAGYYLVGTVEEMTPDDLRAQLETNVVGVQRMIRAVLPTMRARRSGAIVNVSSVAGRVALPVVAAYHASKWALEALSEGLRYEVYPFGIRVAIVEPGPFRTSLHTKERRTPEAPDSPYRALIAAYDRQAAGLKRAHPDKVVQAIFRAATARAPRLRWAIGPTSFSGTVLRRLCPDRVYEWMMRLVFRWGGAAGRASGRTAAGDRV
jgi:NAD(P)-dependent dehydrogenase (short-subunit alcohol dehydrogenase family)